jgi:acyl-CoA thioesterase II
MKEASSDCPDAVESACSAWDGVDIEALVSLEPIGHLRYRSRYGDGNLNGRSYGGQVLGQAMMAASLSAPEDRRASAFQLLFLRGADPDQRIEFEVRILQDGKRFSSRHVCGYQSNGRVVLDAHATFSLPQLAPRHAVASVGREENPDNLPELKILPAALMLQLRPLGPYSNQVKSGMDFRIPDIERQLSATSAQSRLRYWLRGKSPLASHARAHAAVFAYLSDWWLNFSSIGCHLRELQSREPLYIASLNHCIWFHRAFSPDKWMHFESESSCAEGGRGLSIARVHDQDGLMLATATQESLMVYSGV